MPAAFDNCVKNGGKVRTKKLKDGKYMHVCFPKGGGPSVSGHIKKGESMKIKYFESFVPLSESTGTNESVKIKGTAIKATTSRNGITYELAELQKAKNTLMGKTIGLDHSEKVVDTVGIIENVYDTGDGLDFEANITNTGYHPHIVDLVKRGLVNNVSIEAVVPAFKTEDGKKIAVDMEFTGLGIVRTPGIADAKISVAEAFEKSYNEDEAQHKGKCPPGQHMVDGKCVPMDEKESYNEYKGEKHKDNTMEEKTNINSQLLEELKSLRKEVNDMKIKNEEVPETPAPAEPAVPEEPKADESVKAEINELKKTVEDLTKKLEEKTKGIITNSEDKPEIIVRQERSGRVAYFDSPAYIPSHVSQDDRPEV